MEILNPTHVSELFGLYKENELYGKWIHYKHIAPILERYSKTLQVEEIGSSENNVPIHSIKLGTGKRKILIWTQMHGNESTGTKALFDFLNTLILSSEALFKDITTNCTVLCLPMLNPDGSLRYTRVNANNIDLNRDAVNRVAKESKLLRKVLEDFNPDFCFNLHDQRTIFGVEGTKNPATISFLAPSEEESRALTKGRTETMNIIVSMNSLLQKIIPNHIGRYTDEFYPTATGDNFQRLGYNTILIEAGHYQNDYDREETRKFNYFALLQGIYHIAIAKDFSEYEAYFSIPNNEESFYDVIEKDKKLSKSGKAFLFVDKVEDGEFSTAIKLEFEGDVSNFNAHSIKIKK